MGRDCVFCKIARGEINAEKVKESNNFIAIRDIRPAAKGHTLIISKKHFVTLLDIPNTLGAELLQLMKAVAWQDPEQIREIGRIFKAKGYRSFQEFGPGFHWGTYFFWD